jgi:hypothetical protein
MTFVFRSDDRVKTSCMSIACLLLVGREIVTLRVLRKGM